MDATRKPAIIAVDDMLVSINRLIQQECEHFKRSILMDVETKTDELFDNIKLNVRDFLHNTVDLIANDQTNDSSDQASADGPVCEDKIICKSENDDDIEVIEIDDDSNDDHNEATEDRLTKALSPRKRKKKRKSQTQIANHHHHHQPQMIKWDNQSLPDYIQERFHFQIEVFDTYEEANKYRLQNNFWYKRVYKNKNGTAIASSCWNYLQCRSKVCIWKSDTDRNDQRFHVLSNGIPHNHGPDAAKQPMAPQFIREVEQLWKKGVRMPKEVFDRLCQKHGEAAVNGFDILRFFDLMRKKIKK